MQRMFLTLAVVAVLATALMMGCAKSNEVDLRNRNGGDSTVNQCDTANSKYSEDIVPILKANCYSCHNSNNANDGVILENYAGVRSVAVTPTLLGVITHASGYPAMPEGAPQLSDCDINKIRSWINNGAQNN